MCNSRVAVIVCVISVILLRQSWADLTVIGEVRAVYDFHPTTKPAVVYRYGNRLYFSARIGAQHVALTEIDSNNMELSRLVALQDVFVFYDKRFVFSEPPFGLVKSEYILSEKKVVPLSCHDVVSGGNQPFVYYQNGIGYGTFGFSQEGIDFSYTRRYDLYNGVVDDIRCLYQGSSFIETTRDKQHVLDVDSGSAEVVQLPSLRWVSYFRRPQNALSVAGFLGNSLFYYPGTSPDSWVIYSLDGKKIETFRLNLIGKDKLPYKEGVSVYGIYFFEDLRNCMVEVSGGPNWLLVDTSELQDWLVENGYLFASHDDILVEDAVLLENANPDAKVMGKGIRGEQVTLLDKSGAVTTLGGQTAFWYEARTASGAEGWVFGAALKSTDTQEVVDSSLHTAVRVKQLSTSSFLTEPTDLNLYQPVKVFDEHTNTGWLEKAAGPGIGESVTIGLEEPILVDTIKVRPGYFDERYWQQNNRVKKLEVVLDGAKRVMGSFKDKMEVQDIALNPPVRFSTAQFIIREVYKTAKWDDTGLSEVEFWYKGHKYPVDITRFAEELKKKPK